MEGREREQAGGAPWLRLPDGIRRPLTRLEREGAPLPDGAVILGGQGAEEDRRRVTVTVTLTEMAALSVVRKAIEASGYSVRTDLRRITVAFGRVTPGGNGAEERQSAVADSGEPPADKPGSAPMCWRLARDQAIQLEEYARKLREKAEAELARAAD